MYFKYVFEILIFEILYNSADDPSTSVDINTDYVQGAPKKYPLKNFANFFLKQS